MPVTIAKLAEPLPSISLPHHEILEGEPHAGGQFTAKSADGNASAGFWSCDVGRYQFHFDYDEFIYLVRGEVIVTDLATGTSQTINEGDTAFFPQGVTTIWQITRRMTKYFVARSPY